MRYMIPFVVVAAFPSAHAALGPNLLADSDMEAAGTEAWPSPGAVRLAEKSSAEAHSGQQCLRVATEPSGWAGIRKTVTGLRAGATYRFSCWAKVLRGDVRVDMAVGDGRQWVNVFGGHGLAGPGIWWLTVKYVRLRDPSRCAASPTGNLDEVTQLRVQLRGGPGGAVEFLVDDVELCESLDPLAGGLVANGSFEAGTEAPAGWATTDAARHEGLAADGAACVRLMPKARVAQRMRMAANTWHVVRYEWNTAGRGNVGVGLSCEFPDGKRWLDPRQPGETTASATFMSPYVHAGFTRGFTRTGVTFRTPAPGGEYELVFVNRGHNAAYLDAVALAPHEPASASWQPFEISTDGDGSVTGRPLRDVAGYLAGGRHSLEDVRGQRTRIDRDGFIRVDQAGHFVNGRGERVRFYAVNMPGRFAMAETMDDARRIANRLAKLGVNLVRIHGADFKEVTWAKGRPGLFGPASWRPGTTDLYPDSLRRLDAFVAQCKAHGMYVQLDLLTSRTFTLADGVVDCDALTQLTNWHRTRLFVTSYDRRLIELQKRFQTQLLTHVNPHTGLRYAADPVVASVELKNEEGLLYCGFTRTMYSGYPKYYQRQLAERWNQWLSQRYRDTKALGRAWRGDGRTGLAKGEALGSVQFAPELRDIGPYTPARYADMTRFVSQLTGSYQREMIARLRGLGLKCPIRDSQAQRRPCQQRAQARLDYIDAHSYWSSAFDQAMVHTAGGNIVSPAFLAVDGLPMSVSEYNAYCGHQFRAEMPILFAAYAAFQDWDSITLHSYGSAHGRLDGTALQFHYIASYGDPAIVSQFPVAARILRDGLVQPGRDTVHVSYTPRQCDSGQPARMAAPRETALVHRVRTRSFDADRQDEPMAAPKAPYVSDTEELRWDMTAGVVTVEAPQVEAAIGFIGGRPLRLKHMAIDAKTRFAAISLLARDGHDLATSSSILLTAVAQAENTGTTWDNDRNAVLCYGFQPVLAEGVDAEIRLRVSRGIQVFALGPDGARKAKAPARFEGTALRFRLDPQLATLWYELALE